MRHGFRGAFVNGRGRIWGPQMTRAHRGQAQDGRNPAPVDMVNIPVFTRFYICQVVQDFFHQQYLRYLVQHFVLFGDLFWNILSIVHDKPHSSVHSVHRPVIMVGEQFPHLPDDHAWGLMHRCCHCKFPVIPLHAKSITLLCSGYLFWNIV